MSRAVASRIGGSALFALVFSCIFVVPLLPLAWHGLLYRVLYSAIFFSAAFTLERAGKTILGVAIVAAAVEWGADFLNLSLLTYVARFFNVAFFVYMVVALIAQIARVRDVDPRTILAAINGYLLLGLASSMSIAGTLALSPMAFAFSDGTALTEFSEIIYYGFVTLTTVGYGDVTPAASYSRSLSMLIGVAGQLYVAVIIAMLVGKYAATRK